MHQGDWERGHRWMFGLLASRTIQKPHNQCTWKLMQNIFELPKKQKPSAPHAYLCGESRCMFVECLTVSPASYFCLTPWHGHVPSLPPACVFVYSGTRKPATIMMLMMMSVPRPCPNVWVVFPVVRPTGGVSTSACLHALGVFNS